MRPSSRPSYRFRTRFGLCPAANGSARRPATPLPPAAKPLGESAGRKLYFNIGDIFPNLSYPVVASVGRCYFDVLYEASKQHAPEPLGDNATKEFVLRHVFEIAPELIRQPADLLRVLLRRHYRNQRIPAILDEWFIRLLHRNNVFDNWPLETIVPDREAFLSFLQERWPIFLDHQAAKGASGVHEYVAPYDTAIRGPGELPFDHAEASLHARANGSAPLKDLLDSPSFFPLQIKPIPAENLVAVSSRLDILRHGLDAFLVLLRK